MEFSLQSLMGFSADEAERILASRAARAGHNPIALALFQREAKSRGHAWAASPTWGGTAYDKWREEASKASDWQAIQPPERGEGLAHSTCTGRTAYAVLPDLSLVVARTGAIPNGPFETYSDQVVAAAFRLHPDGRTEIVGLWPDVNNAVHLQKLEERLDKLRQGHEQAWKTCEKEQENCSDEAWLEAQRKAQVVMAAYHAASEKHLTEVGRSGITDYCLRGLGLKWAGGRIVLL